MNELVKRLSEEQKIEVSLRPEADRESFRAALERGYVHVLFPATRGGTELGIALDREASDLDSAAADDAGGRLHLEGDLILDDVPVRFVGDVEVASLQGTGRLQPFEDAA